MPVAIVESGHGYLVDTSSEYLGLVGLKNQVAFIDGMELMFYVLELQDNVAEIFLTDEPNLINMLKGCK